VQTQEYLPRKPRFTIEVQKSQSQGCRATFSYRVKITGANEFWLTVTRTDLKQGWDHDLHVRWQASGSAPSVPTEDDSIGYDNEVAQMVAMGYPVEKARQALHLKGGDLGAAASFIGACDVADQMSAEDANRPTAMEATEAAETGGGEEAPVELLHVGQNAVVVVEESEADPCFGAGSSDVEPIKPVAAATALACKESMLEPEPLAGWSRSELQQ